MRSAAKWSKRASNLKSSETTVSQIPTPVQGKKEERGMEENKENSMEPLLELEVKTMNHIEGTHQDISYATYM